MFKKFLLLFLTLSLLSTSSFAFASDNYGDNNTNVNDNINDNIEFLELVSGSGYSLNNGFVFNVTKNTSLDDFKNNFYNSDKVSVGDNSGMFVKTGDIIKYDGVLDDDHLAVVVGDIDCNGYTTVTDITFALNHILETNVISENTAPFYAADLDRNGEINVVDVMSVLNVALK